MKKYIIPLTGFLLLALLLGFALVKIRSGEMAPKALPSALLNKPLPPFRLAGLHDPDKQHTNNDFAGRIFLLNTWASWCVACRQEHPLLTVLPRRDGVMLVGLNYKDKRENALGFLKELGDAFDQILVDPKGRYGIDIGIVAVPETFLVDSRGIVRYKHIGPITRKSWDEKIMPRVRQLRAKASQPGS